MDFKRFETDVLYQKFITATPYNHVIIDDFADPQYLSELHNEIKGYKEMMDEEHRKFDSDTIVQSKKSGFSDVSRMGPLARNFFTIASSPAMINFVEKITGIEGLLPDPSFFGGGIHRTTKGGRLGIHADFNIHPYNHTYRRVNVLLYLNDTWKPEYNGELELWPKNMSACAKKIPPIFNRMVIFRITDDAFHGHPIPWEGEEPRLSLALYYYSKDRPEEEKSPRHMAIWKHRFPNEY